MKVLQSRILSNWRRWGWKKKIIIVVMILVFIGLFIPVNIPFESFSMQCDYCPTDSLCDCPHTEVVWQRLPIYKITLLIVLGVIYNLFS